MVSRKRAGTSRPVTGGDSTVATRPRSASVLIWETGKTNRQRAEELVQALGYRAIAVEDAAEAEQHMTSDTPPELALIGLPGGEAVARAMNARGDARPALVLAVSGTTSEATEACDELGAEAFVIRPYKRDGLASALRAVEAVRAERARAVALAAELAGERTRLLRFGEVDPATGFHHFEFFKRLLVIELKRARRYGYSLAACLIAIDEERVTGLAPGARQIVYESIARALRGVIRDIDLPVDYADGRFLVFLPYTDLDGAQRVGRRLESSVRGDGDVTVSVGIAALRPGKAVSFAKIIRDASLALRAAQLKGGAQVVARG